MQSNPSFLVQDLTLVLTTDSKRTVLNLPAFSSHTVFHFPKCQECSMCSVHDILQICKALIFMLLSQTSKQHLDETNILLRKHRNLLCVLTVVGMESGLFWSQCAFCIFSKCYQCSLQARCYSSQLIDNQLILIQTTEPPLELTTYEEKKRKIC